MKRLHSPKESNPDVIIAKRKEIDLSGQFILRALEPYGVALTPPQVEAIRRYLATLLFWNQKVNLTSLTDPQEILTRHFGESLFAVKAVPVSRGRLADVGSGAGFPGLAIKVICNQLDISLIEPNQKKAAFLAEVTRALGVGKVEILRERMADLYLPDSFEFVAARAVGSLSSLLEWAQNSLVKGGQVLLWLGANDAQQACSIRSWSWRAPILLPRSRRRVLLIGRASVK